MMALTWEAPKLRHGPSHLLEWQRADYRLDKRGGTTIGTARCDVQAEDAEDGGLIRKRFVFNDTVEVIVWEMPPTAEGAGTGHAVWDASIALSMMLAHSCHGNTFIELGCGCALPSATVKQVAAGRVVATDGQPKLLDALQLNDVETRLLCWSSYISSGECDECFDVVIGAEILYAAPDILPLSRILPNLVADNGLVLLVSLARRRPLLETLGRRLSDYFDVTYDTVALTGSSPDEPSLRVTIDDNPVVSLVVLQARRRLPAES